MRRPDRLSLVCHGSVILRIDAPPPHRRRVPAALRGAGGGQRAAAARRGAGRACLPDDRDPLSAERARRCCGVALARVPRRLTGRAAHADGQARRDDPYAGLPAVGDRERRRRGLGGRPRPASLLRISTRTNTPAKRIRLPEAPIYVWGGSGVAWLALRRQRLGGPRHRRRPTVSVRASSSATGRRGSPPAPRRGCSRIATVRSCASTARGRRRYAASRRTSCARPSG